MLYMALLVGLVFVLSACAKDPLIEIICADAPDKQRCLEEKSKQ